MRVLVTGGRGYSNVDEARRQLVELDPNAIIVHGAASGADSVVALVADSLGMLVEAHPADWQGLCRDECKHKRRGVGGHSYCPAAGNYRNQEMADLGADLCIVFPGGKGTADMVRRAKAAGIPIRMVGE